MLGVGNLNNNILVCRRLIKAISVTVNVGIVLLWYDGRDLTPDNHSVTLLLSTLPAYLPHLPVDTRYFQSIMMTLCSKICFDTLALPDNTPFRVTSVKISDI